MLRHARFAAIGLSMAALASAFAADGLANPPSGQPPAAPKVVTTSLPAPRPPAPPAPRPPTPTAPRPAAPKAAGTAAAAPKTPAGAARGTQVTGRRQTSTGSVRTLQRDFASGARATERVRKTQLPAAEHDGRTIQYRESAKRVVRQTTTDGPVRDGKFERTTRTLVVQPSPPTRPHEGKPAAPSSSSFGGVPRVNPRHIAALKSNKQLGAIYDAKGVKARLFAPSARSVHLVLDDTGERFKAISDRAGVWEANTGKAPEKLYGSRYHFDVDGNKVTDPYAHATEGDYGSGRFVNLRAYQWHDQDFRAPERQMVIAEVHVRDMSASKTAPVPANVRGKYAGFSAPRVVDHYKQLGISGIEILPVHEYDDASGDGGTLNHWGYMTTQFLSPEVRYAVDPKRAPQELMAAVDAYHQKGIAVIMDVVYNHTATGPQIAFNALGKSYFYRLRQDGKNFNGAGTGNELATERPMARKLIVDSVRHFVTHYHVDGFRFDLGSLLDVKTMRVIDRALPPRVFLTSEPWAAEGDRARWGKGDLAGALADTRWSVWNDDFRNSVNEFVSTTSHSDETRSRVMTAIAGSARPHGFSLRPSQVVNYVESHDEHTVADRMGGDKARGLVGAVLLMTSQGTAMLGHGQEFSRSKKGIANAHNLDNDVSHVDWTLTEKNSDVLGVYKALIGLRNELPQFRYDRPLTEREIKWVHPEHGVKGGIGYFLPAPEPPAGQTRAPDVAVFVNAERSESAWFKLPESGDWQIVVHGTKVGSDYRGVKKANGWYEVQPGTAAVIMRSSSRR